MAVMTKPPLRILIVEDDVEVRDTMCELLAELGYEVECANHGAQAVDRLHAARELPSLVLLDLMMPGMNGWEVLDELRRHERFAGLPVVVTSASPRLVPAATRVLPKPFSLSQLVACIEQHRGASMRGELPTR